MELSAKGSFYRDLSLITSRDLKKLVKEKLLQIQNANRISQISNLKKLKQYSVCYRIKIAEDYRIGIIIRSKKVTVIRFGHRNNFYNKFP